LRRGAEDFVVELVAGHAELLAVRIGCFPPDGTRADIQLMMAPPLQRGNTAYDAPHHRAASPRRTWARSEDIAGMARSYKCPQDNRHDCLQLAARQRGVENGVTAPKGCWSNRLRSGRDSGD